MNVNNPIINTGTDEMLSNVDVLHSGMRVRIVHACDGALVVAI